MGARGTLGQVVYDYLKDERDLYVVTADLMHASGFDRVKKRFSGTFSKCWNSGAKSYWSFCRIGKIWNPRYSNVVGNVYLCQSSRSSEKLYGIYAVQCQINRYGQWIHTVRI